MNSLLFLPKTRPTSVSPLFLPKTSPVQFLRFLFPKPGPVLNSLLFLPKTRPSSVSPLFLPKTQLSSVFYHFSPIHPIPLSPFFLIHPSFSVYSSQSIPVPLFVPNTFQFNFSIISSFQFLQNPAQFSFSVISLQFIPVQFFHYFFPWA